MITTELGPQAQGLLSSLRERADSSGDEYNDTADAYAGAMRLVERRLEQVLLEAKEQERARISSELDSLKTHLTDEGNPEYAEEAWTTYEVRKIITLKENES